jgi:hypothetical protein
MTVAIAFNVGAYGTYLEWCLTTLTSSDPIVAPFTKRGNSHKFLGNHLINFSNWQDYNTSGNVFDFFRFHPKVQQEELISNNLNEICKSVDSLIYLYPDKNSILLCINNWFSKIHDDWWSAQFSTYVDPDKIYNNWPVNRDTKIENIPRWIRREFLSYYLMPGWFDQVEWYHPDTWQHDRCCVVTIGELLYNFEETLSKLESHCDLKYAIPITELLPFHRQNLQNQQYLNEDLLCKQIVDAVVGGQEFSWESRSLASESWIQWQLRNLGYEIRCHELDIFPTNSVQLKELLHTI